MTTAGTEHPISRMVSSLSKRLTVLIPVTMFLGLCIGAAVDLSPLKMLVLPLTVLMIYPMLIDFRPIEALKVRDGRAVTVAMALNFVIWPILSWALARLFFSNEPGLFVGFLLIGIFPTSGMTISWTGLAKGNVPAAVKMTVVGLITAAFLAPAYLLVLAGTVVDVDVWAVARTVAVVIFLPMAVGVLTRRLLVGRYGAETYKKDIAPVLPGLSTIGVLAIVFLAIGLKAKMILGSPVLLFRVALPLLLFYALAFALSTLIGRIALCRGDAVAAVYGSVMRNLSVALGIAVASFGPEAALVIAAAYMVQVQGAAWYVHASRPVFASSEECTLSSAA